MAIPASSNALENRRSSANLIGSTVPRNRPSPEQGLAQLGHLRTRLSAHLSGPRRIWGQTAGGPGVLLKSSHADRFDIYPRPARTGPCC